MPRHRAALAAVLLLVVPLAGCLEAADDLARLVGLAEPAPRSEPLPVPPGDGNLTVHFLDVGQGDAVLLRFPGGHDVLMDAGPPGADDELVQDLADLGVTTLWALVVSHGDADHVGSAVDVLDAVRVERVYDPGYPKTTRTYERFLEAVDAEGAAYFTADDFEPGDTLPVDANATVTLLYPDAVDPSGEPNDEGIVLRVQYGSVSFLLPGDAGFAAERDLVRSGFTLESTVLKVGHHGSRYSSSREFLDAVRPEVAVVSVGDNNYGHPTYEALYRIQETGATVYRTDEQGTVTVTTDGVTYDVLTEGAGPAPGGGGA